MFVTLISGLAITLGLSQGFTADSSTEAKQADGTTVVVIASFPGKNAQRRF